MKRNRSDTHIFGDITVVDLTTYVTGGFASLMLSNQGADVIKVERPEVGDDIRHSGPPFVQGSSSEGDGTTAAAEGESPYYWTVNYDKRSVELDLKTEAGLEALYSIVADADVFIENFRPGKAEGLGVDYESIAEKNENIIYCSISAFGESGPWSNRPGYDLLIQGVSGLMSVTGDRNGAPVKIGVPQTDLITAMWASFGIASALYKRNVTGQGDRIELSMLDGTLPWLTKQAGKVFAGMETRRMGTRDPVLAPYQSYPTKDGYLNVACANQKLWEQLCDGIDQPDLVDDPRFKTNSARVENMDALEAELSDVFERRTTAEWMEQLAENRDLPVGPINSVSEALNHPQTEARDMVTMMEHPVAGTIPVIEHPLNFSNSSSGFRSSPPLLGEHTRAVLRECGYSEERIDELEESGAIPP